MHPWKTLSRKVILSAGEYLTVESHQIQLPDGRRIDEWSWVITPDYVNVAAITRDGQFLCFRQSKYAVDGLSLSVVGGYLAPGEVPLAAAQRELLEETGYAAAKWLALGRYAVDGNRGCGYAHLFLARDAHAVQAIDADDLEEQELLLLSRAEVAQALQAGDFKVLPWATVIALALARLDQIEEAEDG